MKYRKYFVLIGVFLGAWMIIAFSDDPREGPVIQLIGLILSIVTLIHFLEVYRKSIVDDIIQKLNKDSGYVSKKTDSK